MVPSIPSGDDGPPFTRYYTRPEDRAPGCKAYRNGNLTCLVLDLDNTLIETRNGNAERLAIQKSLRERGELDRYYEFALDGRVYWGVKRPYYRFFLEWAFATFDVVGVWTAAEADYAAEIVKAVFPQTPHFVWSRDECVNLGGTYYKPLEKLFIRFPHLDRDNTVIIDDRKDISVYNVVLLIEIPSFDYKNPLTYDRALIVILQFIRDTLRSGKTLREADKSGLVW
jgi:TFIIF-interacting CTD phosphatase-like protein